MLRRYVAYLLVFFCAFAAPAQAFAFNDIGDLAILSQWDERFMDGAFKYNNTLFRYGGCGPASVTNGVIAALDVTDQDLAAGMLSDLLNMLTIFRPLQRKIQLNLLSDLTFKDGQWSGADTLYPSLNQALRDFDGTVLYYDKSINAENLPSLLPASESGPIVIHGSFGKDDRWANLRQLIQALMDAGYEDARIILSFLGAGVETTQTPFRSGTAGHYLCACIQMAEFLQTGEFYVLDSLPRALVGEEFAPGQTFQLQYDFAKKQKSPNSLAAFNTLFEVRRVTPTIVRSVPIGEAQQAVQAAQQSGEIPLDALIPFLNEVMQFYGSSHIFISLPER